MWQELRAEAERLTIRNAELSSQLSTAVSRANQLTHSEREATAQAMHAEAQLKAAQQRVAQSATQLAQLRAAEKAWLSERKAIMRQLQSQQPACASCTSVSPVGAPMSSYAEAQRASVPRAAAASSSAAAVTTTATAASSRRAPTVRHTKDVKAAAAEEVEQELAAARMRQKLT